MSLPVSAIVPAYNEASRIGAVLEVLNTYPGFTEVIVVDDGSTDSTAEVAQAYSVRCLRSEINRGKGLAMDQGVASVRGDIIFFSDADMQGLTHEIIAALLAPVQRGEAEMCIAMPDRKIYPTRFVGQAVRQGSMLHVSPVRFVVPLVGGVRALTRNLWEQLPAYYKHQHRIEPGLNYYAKHYGRGYRYQVFPGLTQTIKEKKYGWGEGLRRRGGFLLDLVQAYGRLQTLTLRRYLP